MAYDVSPYLLLPRRDLPTACRQIRQAKGIAAAPCGSCALSDMCKSAEAQVVSQLPQPFKGSTSRAVTCLRRRKAAA